MTKNALFKISGQIQLHNSDLCIVAGNESKETYSIVQNILGEVYICKNVKKQKINLVFGI